MAIADILAEHIENWSRRESPAAESALAALAAATGCPLPPGYLEFLRVSNGGEGDLCIEPWWFCVWPAEEVMENNTGYKFAEFAPDFLGFATNGGGDFLCFHRQRTDDAVFMLPMIPMCESDAQEIAFDFEMFAMACGVPPSPG